MKITFGVDKKEKWGKIKNHSSYLVSDSGKVKRVRNGQSTYAGKVLKPAITKDGYLYINLCENGKRKSIAIHKLVAEAFIGPCPKGKEVNHIDGNKENPCADNLEYVTRSENLKHSYKLGLQNKKGENHHLHKLREHDIKKIRKLYKTGEYYQRELSAKFNVTIATISYVVNNKSWKHII